MKLFVALACLVVAISAASDQDLWDEFKNNHGKTYRSLREEKLRFNIFQGKLREIDLHNAKYEKGEVSYFMKVNQFSDLTTDEFVARLNRNIATIPKLHTTPFENELEASLPVPDEINWVEKGAVLGVMDQGDCGSCWAFSAVGSIEGQNAIKKNVTVPLSEQQLVDCSTANLGCYGGNMEPAFDWVKANGLTTEASYPYTATHGPCQSETGPYKISGYVNVTKGESALKRAVGTVGPITVAIEADTWQSYGGGIFDNDRCTWTFNHGVVVVGYGKDTGKKYWLIKNSWGTSWGEHGYMRLVRNKGEQCGVGRRSSYPKL